MRAPRWIVPAVVVGAFAALPGVASAAIHRCAAVTIGADRYTHVTARGVTCKYVRKVFIPSIDKLTEPHGWAQAPPVHITSTKVRDTYLDGSKKIVFVFTLSG